MTREFDTRREAQDFIDSAGMTDCVPQANKRTGRWNIYMIVPDRLFQDEDMWVKDK